MDGLAMMLGSTEALDELTDREYEVCQLIANGYSLKDAGDMLDIAEVTVGVHLFRAANKLPGSGRPSIKAARCWHLFETHDA